MKILIAYYSLGGNTEKLAKAIRLKFEKNGHLVDEERIFSQKEQSPWQWWRQRFLKSECEIRPPVIVDVSGYDVICFGGPNWTGLSLPLKAYIGRIKGLERKNVGFFATTALWPKFEWYIFSAYLLDFAFARLVEKHRAKLIGSILLSSFFKDWGVESEYGRQEINGFCQKLESVSCVQKEFFLHQREVENLRLLVVIITTFLISSFIFQVATSLFKAPVFSWLEYFCLFFGGLLTDFLILMAMSGKKIFWAKYLAAVSLIFIWTGVVLFSFFSSIFFGRALIFGFGLIMAFFAFFYNVSLVLFVGSLALGIFSYFTLFSSFAATFNPTIDMFFLFGIIGVIGLISYFLEKHYFDLLEIRDELECSKQDLEKEVAERTQELRDLAGTLDLMVKDKTHELENSKKELQERVDELELFRKVSVDRELKMIELKEEIAKLKQKGR